MASPPLSSSQDPTTPAPVPGIVPPQPDPEKGRVSMAIKPQDHHKEEEKIKSTTPSPPLQPPQKSGLRTPSKRPGTHAPPKNHVSQKGGPSLRPWLLNDHHSQTRRSLIGDHLSLQSVHACPAGCVWRAGCQGVKQGSFPVPSYHPYPPSTALFRFCPSTAQEQ